MKGNSLGGTLSVAKLIEERAPPLFRGAFSDNPEGVILDNFFWGQAMRRS